MNSKHHHFEVFNYFEKFCELILTNAMKVLINNLKNLFKDSIVILENTLLFCGINIMLNFNHKYTSVARTFIIGRTDTCENYRYHCKVNLFLPF